MTQIIALQEVCIARNGVRVLDRLSLALHAGERLAIAGANGAGKSTLLRTIVGLEKAMEGKVSIFGKARQSEKDFKEVRTRIGLLFQDADDQLFCPTVIEDVAFGPLNTGLSRKDAFDKARATLGRMQLDHLADRVTYRLSGGEKRLVCLAGLLAMEPQVLLLDEPTSGLDDANYARLMEILAALPAAMILVSHDAAFLGRLATRAACLKSGQLSQARVHRHPHVHDHVHIHADD